MKISILCSSKLHPVYPFLEQWVARRSGEHNVELVSSVEQLSGGDVLFLVSCSEVVARSVRGLYKSTLVIHASDLPKGRGWSPHIWQILEGKNSIIVTLLEAEDKIDTGAIWHQLQLLLQGHELYDEINALLFNVELQLMDYAVENWGQVVPRQQNTKVMSSFYRRRTPDDSEIDPDRSLKEVFNNLRVADNRRFPAFFYLKGKKYVVKLEKVD